MGVRFYRRVNLFSGVYLNFSKSGTSLSVRGPGLSSTIGPRGTRTSVGIPGTGIRYEQVEGSGGKSGRTLHPSSGGGGYGGETGMRQQLIETPQLQKIAATYQAVFTGLLIFRLCYIVGGVIALFSIWRHGGSFGRLFVWMAILAIVDYFASGIAKYQARLAIQTQLNIDEAERRKVKEQHERALQNIQDAKAQAWADRCQSLGSLIAIQSSFPCKRGEGVLYTESHVCLQETRKARLSGGTTTDQWTTLDTGTLYLTNQRIVFVGDNGSRKMAIKDILDTQYDLESIKLTAINRAKPMGFITRNPSLIVTMISAVQDYPDLPLVSEESQPSASQSQSQG